MHNDRMSVQAMSNQHTTTMQSLLNLLKFKVYKSCTI